MVFSSALYIAESVTPASWVFESSQSCHDATSSSFRSSQCILYNTVIKFSMWFQYSLLLFCVILSFSWGFTGEVPHVGPGQLSSVISSVWGNSFCIICHFFVFPLGGWIQHFSLEFLHDDQFIIIQAVSFLFLDSVLPTLWQPMYAEFIIAVVGFPVYNKLIVSCSCSFRVVVVLSSLACNISLKILYLIFLIFFRRF